MPSVTSTMVMPFISWSILFGSIIGTGCTDAPPTSIRKFEKALGQQRVACLDLLIQELDTVLHARYVDTPDKYGAFLQDLSEGSIQPFDLTTQELYEKANALGLLERPYNPSGHFRSALLTVREDVPLVSKYLEYIDLVDTLAPAILAQTLLDHRSPDAEYFMQRILLVDLLR